MNPFTKFLSQWSTNDRFANFVEHWDRLERLVVEVYRQKQDWQAAAPEFHEVWPLLRQNYRDWEAILRPYWQQTSAGGKPTETDPFQLLLGLSSPSDIPGNWRIMQHLPAARESINRYLVENGV